jgi:hypothetical protein
MTPEEDLRGNMPIKQFDELAKALKDEYGITMNERPQRIGEIRLAPLDLPSPQHKYQDWWLDEIPLAGLSIVPITGPTTLYVIPQPKPTRWQRFKNYLKKWNLMTIKKKR